MKKRTINYNQQPDSKGHFGNFGGRYVAETLMPLILEVNEAYQAARQDPDFIKELDYYHQHYIGRPSPLWPAKRLSEHLGGAQIFFKRDELNHTGSHKINNCIAQALLAMRMGKRRIIAETGAGMHGVATATIAALFDLPCAVYMGTKDISRQSVNVERMHLLGAKIIPCKDGCASLKEAMNHALRDWVGNVDDTYYLIGTCAGPHPYPQMVRDFQSVIGKEVKRQLRTFTDRPPDYLVACVGGGSNALGLFFPYLEQPEVQLIGVEAGGLGIDSESHGAALSQGAPGILHGNKSYYLQDDNGQIREAYSISAGLDYPGVGPEHAWLKTIGRATYHSATDTEALAALKLCSKLEGIIPALEPAHALAEVIKLAPTLAREQIIVVNICGRGDKDLANIKQSENNQFQKNNYRA